MNKDFLTVEQISELLHIHPKTTQRYIREGKLRAIKVGKSWRVSGHDLSVFLENANICDNNSKALHTIKASSVIDITANGVEDATRIMNILTSALISKPPEFSNSSIQSQYIEHENIIRVMLWGDIRFISATMDMIVTITE